MLLPRFGIRGLLGGMTGCAVAALIVSLAISGRPWAVAASVGLAALVVWMILSALLFAMAILFGVITRQGQTPENPFAGQSPPPQLLRPVDPEG